MRALERSRYAETQRRTSDFLDAEKAELGLADGWSDNFAEFWRRRAMEFDAGLELLAWCGL
ncbi:MAG: hypothetical protein DME33_09115 [Verrucomicrobia bacterium]|nr:MAG: hypothetical protein DME33_09115 [Verrucomicrobiota bacterium]